MSNFPHDVLVEVLSIFARQVTAACVCKQWLSVISDPGFAVLQYERTAENSPPKILLSKCSLYSKDSPLQSSILRKWKKLLT